MLHYAQNSFSAGALTPYVSARPSLEVYSQGATTLNNWMTIPYGGIRYRPGTEFIAHSKAYADVDLYAFEFGTGDRHVLEFGSGYIRFYNPGLTGYGVIGAPYEVSTPYVSAELPQLQFAQLNDIVIITHPNHPPYRLSRYGETNWVMEEYPIANPPFLDPEIDETKGITASATTGTGITLTTSVDVFDPLHVGSTWELAYRRNSDEIIQELDIPELGANITVPHAGLPDSLTVKDGRTGGTKSRTNLLLGDPVRCSGSFLVQTFGTWHARIEVFKRYIGQTNWEEYLTFEGHADRNLNEAYTLDAPAEIRTSITYIHGKHSGFDELQSTDGRIVLSVDDPYIRGRVEITGYTNAQSVTADVLVDLADDISTEWSEGAFSDYRGYPRAVTFHSQRLWFGGTISRPQTMWGSRIDGYDDFTRPFSTDAASDLDAPIQLPVFSEQQNTIEWMSSNRSLLVGTSAGEFVITGETREESISVGDYNIRRHTSKGSADLQAIPVDGQCLFVQRQGRKLRRMGYQFDKDAYSADDLTIYNEHLTRAGIKSICYQRQRDPFIWAVTNDGKLVGWSYRESQPFLAAFEVTTDGTFEAATTVYGDGDEDELWVVVDRNGFKNIERFRPDQLIAQEGADMSNLWFLDSAVQFSGATATLTGLAHLEGKEVMIVNDGVYKGTRTVSGGQVSNYDNNALVTLVGLFYENEWETMDVEPGANNGTTVGRMKTCGQVVMRFFKSIGGKFEMSQNDQEIAVRDLNPQQSLVTPRPLKDLDIVQPCMPGETRRLRFSGRQNVPYPMTIISIGGRINITEPS